MTALMCRRNTPKKLPTSMAAPVVNRPLRSLAYLVSPPAHALVQQSQAAFIGDMLVGEFVSRYCDRRGSGRCPSHTQPRSVTYVSELLLMGEQVSHATRCEGGALRRVASMPPSSAVEDDADE